MYRPFDYRYTWFTNRSSGLLGRPRYSVMKHLASKNNLGLITMRQIVNQEYSHFGVTDRIACHGTFYLGNKGQDYVFPLYLYPDSDKPKELQQEKNPNFSLDFLKTIESKLGYLPTPETIFYYIYAIFHSPTYRTRYIEDLKLDFPRVPLTSNDKLFRQLADYGEQLVQLHLMASPKLDNLITEFVEGTGKRTVAPGHPKYSGGAVHINKNGDKFTGIPEEVWNFYVGGYQPCQKWLKDRKERTLSDEDILHYQKMVVSLKETIELMKKIDKAIPSFPIQ
jgi:predicted helicase